MATTVYNLTGSGGTNASAQIYFNGEWADATVGSRSGRALTGRQAEVTFTVTGTDATLQGYLQSGANLQPVAVSVDGGAFTLIPALTLATWTTITLFSGLSDAAHTVVVRDQGAAAGLSFYVDKDSIVTVTGAAPAIAAPTGYGNQYRVRASGVDAYVVPEGGLANTTNQGNLCKSVAWPDTSFHFKATIATLSIWCFRDAKKFALWIDGVQQAVQTLPSGSTWGRVELYTGLDDTGEHDYVLQFGNASGLIHDLMTTGGAGLNTTPLAARDHMAFYGDSRTANQSGAEGSSTAGYPFRVGMALGCAVYNRGIGSTANRNYGAGGSGCTTSSGEARFADITNLSPEPTRVFDFYGVVDAVGSCGGAPTNANFKTSETSKLTSMVAGLSPTVQYYRHPIGISSGNGTVDTNVIPGLNTAISEAVSELGEANVIHLPTGMVFTVLHPGSAENAEFAALIVAAIETAEGGGEDTRRFMVRA